MIKVGLLSISILLMAVVLPNLVSAAAPNCGTLPPALSSQIAACIPTTMASPGGLTPNNFQWQFNSLPFNALKGNWTFYNANYQPGFGTPAQQFPCWAENASSIWCNLEAGYQLSTSPAVMAFALGPPGTSFWSANVGEAPQLSPSYGEWDNGNNVFAFYDNFNGISLSIKWGTPNPSQVTINNGLVITSSGPAYWINTNSIYQTLFASNIIFTSLIKSTGGGLQWFCTLPGFSSCAGGSVIPISSQWSLIPSNNIGLGSTSNTYLIDTVGQASTINAQYVRATLYPPSGIMPTVSYGSPITLFAPVYLQNTTSNPAVQFPSLVGIPACTANTLAGTCSGNDVITGTGALKSNVYVFGNIIVSSGSTLTTNGFGMFTTGTFNSIGATIKTGQTTLSLPGGSSAAGGNVLISYGGSGGGGGGAYTSSTTGNGANGGNTIAAAGLGGIDNTGGNGNTPAIPALTSVNAIAYCNNPSYLTGASGGGGAGIGSSSPSTGGTGGYGAYGICIEANTLRLGTITANGITGSGGQGGSGWSYGGGGGGGGGRIILIYGTGGYTAGTYNILGGAGEGGGSNGGTGYTGGTGGSGNVIVASGSLLIPIVSTQLYPLELYTSNPSLTYTLNSVVGGIQTTLQSSNTLAYVPPANQATGIYNYSVAEWNGTGTYIIPINISINMTDITSPLVFNGICALKIQDGVNCAKAPTFDTKVSQWNIKGDNPLNGYANGNYVSGGNNLDAWSNANLTFMPNVILTYFQFSPVIAFPANIVNNPSLTAITQNAMGFVASNVMPSNSIQRRIFNVTSYDQQFLTPLNAITTMTFNWLFNNYSGVASIKSATNITNTLGYLSAFNTTWMENSLYANPPITLSNISTLSSAASHYPAINNFFSNQINYGTWPTYPVYLANNANASLYTFYVYQCSGYAPTGDYMWSYTGFSSSSATAVQRYKISAIPFSLPMQNGQQYQFQFWTPSAGLIYTQPLSVNPLSITVYLPCTQITVVNPAPVINATCNTNTISNMVTCQGIDTQNYVNLWQVSLTYHPTIFTTQTLASNIIPGSSFVWSYQLPNHTTEFYASINATIGRNIDPLIPVMSNYLLFSVGYGLTPGSAYNAMFGILLFFIFIGVAYINEVAAMIGFPIIMILGSFLGIFAFPQQYIYGSVGLMIVIGALMLIFRD